MQKKFDIEVSPTNLDSDILNALQLKLSHNINNSNVSIENFQHLLAEITGSPEVLAVSTGTAALHLSLLALGIKEGDHVACATFTFVATANAISYIKAKPIFIDSEKDTWNMCPQLLETSILDGIKKGRLIKAVVVVHSYGFPAKIEEIVRLCQLYEIPVIEDAASALGSTYKNRCLGTFGTIGTVSFNYNKILTTAGGGALFTQSKELLNKASYFANQAKTSENNYSVHNDIGYNYRLSGMCAELGNVQLPYLNHYIQVKREIHDTYKGSLNKIDEIKFLEEPSNDFFSNRWVTTILFQERELMEKVRLKLEDNLIETKNLWKPMHMQPVFSTYLIYENGNAEYYFKHGLCLPSGINLPKSYQKKIINIIQTFF